MAKVCMTELSNDNSASRHQLQSTFEQQQFSLIRAHLRPFSVIDQNELINYNFRRIKLAIQTRASLTSRILFFSNELCQLESRKDVPQVAFSEKLDSKSSLTAHTSMICCVFSGIGWKECNVWLVMFYVPSYVSAWCFTDTVLPTYVLWPYTWSVLSLHRVHFANELHDLFQSTHKSLFSTCLDFCLPAPHLDCLFCLCNNLYFSIVTQSTTNWNSLTTQCVSVCWEIFYSREKQAGNIFKNH